MAVVVTMTRSDAEHEIKQRLCGPLVDSVRIIDDPPPVPLYRTVHEHSPYAEWRWIETVRDSGWYACAHVYSEGAKFVDNLLLSLADVIGTWKAGPDVRFEPLPKGLSI